MTVQEGGPRPDSTANENFSGAHVMTVEEMGF